MEAGYSEFPTVTSPPEKTPKVTQNPSLSAGCNRVTAGNGGYGGWTQECVNCGQSLDHTDKGITWLIDNGEARHKGACPCDDESARVDAEERAAIQEEGNAEPTPPEIIEDDPLREFEEWIRSKPSKRDTKGKPEGE